MAGWRGLLGAAMLLVCWAASAEVSLPPTRIDLVSEAWEDYTNADGSGLAWDVLREVFQPAGIAVVTRSEPYIRSVGLVQQGQADAWVGSYQNEAHALYPRWHYDTDHIFALSLADKPQVDFASLGGYRLAWVRGYQFQKYLPNVRTYNEVQRRTGILSMLEHDRADYYVDALTEIEVILRQAAEPERFKRVHVAELPLYLGFSDSARGRALLAVYDQRMEQLVKTGQLRGIYQRWGQPYPFDPALPAP
ncbi:transporter substrate-binding domain-containing protein [Pseudomonas sp. CFBP 8758]|uniref:substrate-binding periplasmic protein n=1 Tax=Pseudomonas sp. CFBP 8758 TaxID=2775286 RepID=UPI00177B92FD|nr:transporter substrate-binding domain-containing protein [Pseudomonas sp. CFBP 8758]MBD8594040.1 transporter substrate-binding domain-containing protein [Pseudomonas sp. CFBP 8758]